LETMLDLPAWVGGQAGARASHGQGPLVWLDLKFIPSCRELDNFKSKPTPELQAASVL